MALADIDSTMKKHNKECLVTCWCDGTGTCFCSSLSFDYFSAIVGLLKKKLAEQGSLDLQKADVGSLRSGMSRIWTYNSIRPGCLWPGCFMAHGASILNGGVRGRI